MAPVPKDYDLLATLETKITAAKKAVAAEETKAAAYAADEAALEKMRQDVTAELRAAESAAAAVSGASAAAKWGEAKGIASRLAALPQSVEDLRALWAKQGHPSDARAALGAQAKHTKMPASDATKSKEVVAVEAELARAKAEPHKDVPYLKALKSLITALTELSQKEADFTAKKTELEVGHLQ